MGSALRYLTTLVAMRWLGTDFPFGTLAVNLAGCFAIGLVHEVAAEPVIATGRALLSLRG